MRLVDGCVRRLFVASAGELRLLGEFPAKILKRIDIDFKKLNFGLKFIGGTNNLLLDMTEKKYLIILKKTLANFCEAFESGIEIHDFNIKV